MGKLYENSPIIEAVCEFQFEPNQPWDWTIPGLIYDKIKAEFPKKRQQNAVQMELRAEQQEIAQSIKAVAPRMHFLSDDERLLIQIGPDLVAINHLKPYSNWVIFKETIKKGLSIYREIANPKTLRRIGLRYINRIEIPEQQVKIEEYLIAMPKLPDSVPQMFLSWVQRVEIPFEHVNGLLVIQSGSMREGQEEKITFMLDLDFSTLPVQEVNLDSAMDWVEQAHEEIERTFEACITPQSRELFGEVLHGK